MTKATKTTDDGILRGIELSKRGMFGESKMVCTYKPTTLGARQAASDFKWLSERHPNAGYELRALVSVPRKTEEATPLTLEADSTEPVAANGESGE